MTSSARFLVAEFTDSDFDPAFVPPAKLNGFAVRTAARGLLFHQDKLAFLYVSTEKYHKLPGGGIEPGESKEQAFIREISEETGCTARILSDRPQNSLIIETRHQYQLVQFSYIFAAEVVGQPGKQHLEENEIAEGHDLIWIPVKDANAVLNADRPEGYEARFIHARDLSILNFYLK
jgi:8-oxo-dGTP diphosphatase